MNDERVVGRNVNGRWPARRQSVSEVQSKSDTSRDLRPCAVDTDYATGLETVRVGVLDVSDVPPDLVYACEDRGRCGGEQEE